MADLNSIEKPTDSVAVEETGCESGSTEDLVKGTVTGGEDGTEIEVLPISRKRTRDDTEKQETEETAQEEKRPIAPLKCRKDDASINERIEGSKDVHNAEEPTEKQKDSLELESKSNIEETKTSKDTEDKKKTEQEKEKEAKEGNKSSTEPKFVFGSTTPFGANAFSSLNKNKNVFSSNPNSDSVQSSSSAFVSSSEPSSNSGKSVFGSNSKFGNAIQAAIGKESIFDKPAEDTENKGDQSASSSSNSNNLYKQVDLEKQNIQSGEEDEQQVFTCRAKLYALNLADVTQGWKERGLGNIHVNKSLKEGSKSRIIMRSNGLLKVILNCALVPGLEVVKGMPSSLSSEKFIRITSVENGNPVQYALKAGTVETRTGLYDAIKDLIPETV